MIKRCTKCGEEKGIDLFGLRNDTGRRRNACKKCQSIKHRTENLTEEQIKKRKARQKKYRDSKKGKATIKKWRQENREEINIKQAKRRNKNRKAERRHKKKYRDNNKQKLKEYYPRKNQLDKEKRDKLVDRYVVFLFTSKGALREEITPEMIKMKREQVMLYRLINEIKKEVDDGAT